MSSLDERELLEKYFQEQISRQTDSGINFSKAERVFRKLKIDSIKNLLDRFDQYDSQSQQVAVLIFGEFEIVKSLPILFQGLYSQDAFLPGLCGSSLGRIGGDKVLRKLLKLLSKHSEIRIHYHVLYALKWIDKLSVDAARILTERLGEIAQNGPSAEVVTDRDRQDADSCRGMAAEGLSHSLDYLDRRTKDYRSGVKFLLSLLTDDSAGVRGDAAYSLGYLNEIRALEQLEFLVESDFEICPGIGTVSSIAAESIECIRYHHKLQDGENDTFPM
ncbi:HEAT repeat domain-containing protein [Gimesia algae]|uniref:HEAT repeat protein n=1 Tax=Gimesia algae TaxID=2527971 RepID=A0A517V8A9_9PLAN|nr:HEAT repeat domain-containing protein [Gimesia algae]QDT89247.1 hypothetical protein Pan161_08750 [Gimesia algae]